jgi:hypothetical protein
MRIARGVGNIHCRAMGTLHATVSKAFSYDQENCTLPVCGRCIQTVVVVSDTLDDDGSNSPEHLQHLGGGSSERNGYDLTAVRRGVGDKDTPWDTFEELRDQHDRERVGEVEHKDETVQKHEVGDECPSVTNSAGQRASDNDTNDGTNWTAHLKS